MKIPTMARPGKIAKAATPGKHGGKLQKVAAGPMGHPQQAVTPVQSDRGAFKIKG